MKEWFASFSPIQIVYFCIALPATIFMILQTILLFVGMAHDADVDSGGDTDGADDVSDHDHGDGGLRLLTLRGIIAFLSIGGWAGFAFAEIKMHVAFVILLSLVFGILALLFVALMLKWTMKIQEDGTINLRNAVGKTGEVYLPIGKENSKTGKISLEVQGRYIEMDAMTRCDRDLKVGTAIKVTDMLTETIAVVEPLAG